MKSGALGSNFHANSSPRLGSKADVDIPFKAEEIAEIHLNEAIHRGVALAK